MGSKNQEDSIVLPDAKIADSFLVPEIETPRLVAPNTIDCNGNKSKPVLSRDGLPRKRTCAGSDRGGREEARMMQRLVNERTGPGMWDGIL